MTLIAAFQCSDGAVICADSQETQGRYRMSVEKLVPFTSGNFQVAMAGSGNSGELIDAFTQRIEDNLAGSGITEISEFRTFLQKEMLDFSKNEAVAVARPKDRSMSFIVGATSLVSQAPAFGLWKTSASRIKPFDRYALIGWELPLYEHEARRLYPKSSPSLPINQAMFIGLRLLMIAQNTSNEVHGPFTVLVIRNGCMGVVDEEWVATLQDRLEVFDGQFRNLLLSCPDTSISSKRFNETLKEFEGTILHLRKEYLHETFEHMLYGGGIVAHSRILSEVPPLVAKLRIDGSTEISEEDADLERMRALRAGLKNQPPLNISQTAPPDPQSTTGDPSRQPPSRESPEGSGES
jgi:hypothetical protein